MSLYEPTPPINQRRIRPGIWLLVLASIPFLFVVGYIFSFIEPVGPQGIEVNEVVNPMVEPFQRIIVTQEPVLGQEDTLTWKIHPRAEFSISARIVSKKEYRDWISAFAPLDLMVAWGELSNTEVDQWLSWSQARRSGYMHRSSNSPFTIDYILIHATNIHVIPATENLEIAINELAPENVVLLEGLLVDVESNRVNLYTSLSRTDSGAGEFGTGSCEILYVQRLVVNGIEYR